MLILSTTTHQPPLCLPATRLPPSPGRHTDGSLFRRNTAMGTVLDCGPRFSKLSGFDLQQMPLSDRNWKGNQTGNWCSYCSLNLQRTPLSIWGSHSSQFLISFHLDSCPWLLHRALQSFISNSDCKGISITFFFIIHWLMALRSLGCLHF